MASPYQKALIPGPDKGVPVDDPISMANIIKKSSKVLMVIGVNAVHEKIGNDTYADRLLELGKMVNADIIATSSAFKHFVDTDQDEGVVNMSLINITNRLKDPNWLNLNGKGDKYDMIVFGGFLIYYLSQMLSTLRNYTPYRTISLDRYHHPNARFSLPNIEKDEWIKYLEEIKANL